MFQLVRLAVYGLTRTHLNLEDFMESEADLEDLKKLQRRTMIAQT